MKLHRHNGLFGLAVLTCLILTGIQARAKLPRPAVLLVVPARPRVLQVAMDMVSLRKADLIAYRGGRGAADPLLFAWRRGAWRYVTADDYREGRFAGVMPRQVVLVGEDAIMPTLVAEESGWGAELTRLTSLQAADLINGLDGVLRFSRREWKWLADRYELVLTDINEPYRRYNPYAARRSEQPLPAGEYQQRPGEPPPAVLLPPDDVAAPAADAPTSVLPPDTASEPAPLK